MKDENAKRKKTATIEYYIVGKMNTRDFLFDLKNATGAVYTNFCIDIFSVFCFRKVKC